MIHQTPTVSIPSKTRTPPKSPLNNHWICAFQSLKSYHNNLCTFVLRKAVLRDSIRSHSRQTNWTFFQELMTRTQWSSCQEKSENFGPVRTTTIFFFERKCIFRSCNSKWLIIFFDCIKLVTVYGLWIKIKLF